MSDTAAFDAIIVGSGAAGGMAACELSREGLRVLMLEAGRNHDPETETPMLHIEEIAPLSDCDMKPVTTGGLHR